MSVKSDELVLKAHRHFWGAAIPPQQLMKLGDHARVVFTE
jgi:hypothetical protein